MRYEDERLLTGGGSYVDDVSAPGMLFGYVLRSPHAHARIVTVDTAAARAMPGVALVLTGEDYVASGYGALDQGKPNMRNRQGIPAFFPPRPPLAVGRVRFVGDAVAFVVAKTPDLAKDAAEAIDVAYEPLTANVSTEEVLARKAESLWPERLDNIAFVHEVGDEAAVDAAFARATHVVRHRIRISRVAACTMEPRGCVADYNAKDQRWTVQLGCQRLYTARAEYARIFDVPESALRLVAGDTGGSFGMKATGYPEHMLTVWASRQLARPVKWVATRGEALSADTQGRDNVIDAALALDADGKFLAVKVASTANVGAYPSFSPGGAATNNIGSLAGVYTTPNLFARVTGVYTNTTPIASYRGAGRPEAAYIMERLIDLAAHELGLDRVDLRRRNMIPTSALPYKTGLTYTYDSGEFEAVLDKALALADYAGFAQRRERSRAEGKLRGLGIACTIERAAGETREAVTVRVEPSGKLSVIAGTTDQGQGHKTMYREILSGRLGVPSDGIGVVEGDTDAIALGYGTGGSRVSALGGSAMVLAVDKIIAKGCKIAAHALEAAEADIEFIRGRFAVKGTDVGLSLAEVARLAQSAANLPPGLEPGLEELGHYVGLPNFPNGCHLCEVEIEPETGVVAIVRYTVVDDLGVVINPDIVHGQIQGGVTMGASQALIESTHYDPQSGQLLTGSFMDYCLPRSDLMHEPEIGGHHVPTPTNPLGVKGVGEAGTVGALPAVMNAVIHALSPLGIRHLDMPLTPERVWRAIRENQPL
jgi:aerobic carbon-monoxide dehydrogenase large subunit